MKDEIKEILKYLKKKENTRNIKCITLNETKKLLDYITNLQEENKRLKEDREDISVSNFSLFKQYEEYKSRNEKAIEYVTNGVYFDGSYMCKKDLLNILQGEDNTPENLYRYTPEKGFRLVGDDND